MQTEDIKKQQGMKQAANHHNDILLHFQSLALLLSIYYESVTVDDVRKLATLRGIEFTPGNWMGSVFSGKDWIWTGEMRKAKHVGSRSRMIKVWKRNLANL